MNRGNGMGHDHGNSHAHGNSFANGPSGPPRSWEQQELAAMQETIWKHL
jgi:hypothetical protein